VTDLLLAGATFALALALLQQCQFYARERVQYMLTEMGKGYPWLPERALARVAAVLSMLVAVLCFWRLIGWWTLLAVPLSFLGGLATAVVLGMLAGQLPRLIFWILWGSVLCVEAVLATRVLG
jgi:hypothetical protein